MSAQPGINTEPAGFWRRLAALSYDALVLLALCFVGTALLLPLTGGQALASGNAWYSLYLLAIGFIYNAWFWVHGGQTIGMRAWRLRLYQPSGTGLSWRLACLRYAAALLSLSAAGLGFLWMLVTPARRAWHDRLSNTIILREKT